MATYTINIIHHERITTIPVAVPDQHPSESPSAYKVRITSYLNQRFGEGGWGEITHSAAATRDLQALLTVRADLDPKTTGGTLLEQLTRRANHGKKNKYPKK